MEIDIETTIYELQKQKILPCGDYTYESWQENFSFIFKVEIGKMVYYFKYIKPKEVHNLEEADKKFSQECAAIEKFYPIFSFIDKVKIPRILFSSKEKLLIVTTEIGGEKIKIKFDYYLSRFRFYNNKYSDDALEIARLIGKAINIIHSNEEQDFLDSDIYNLKFYILSRLLSERNFSSCEEKLIKNFIDSSCEKIINNISIYKKNYIHGDLNVSNIYWDDGILGLIDFGNCRMSYKYEDLAIFHLSLFHFLSSRLKHSNKSRKSIFDSFCKGYGIVYEELNSDAMFKMIKLRNLSVLLKTFQNKIQKPFSLNIFPGFFKVFFGQIVNYIEYKTTKRAILNIVRENFDHCE